MAETQGVQSLDRAFEILEHLCAVPEGMAIRDLVAQTKLNKSTIHRMLQAMLQRGYVRQEPITGRYYMTTKLCTLSSMIVDGLDLVRVARLPMEQLSQQLQETVHLVIREDTDIVYVHKVEAVSHSVRMAAQIGMHRPLYCTASGKAILSYMTEEQVASIWQRSNIQAYTAATIVSLPELQQDLEQCRKRRYALDLEENEPGVRCMATAIQDHTGKVCGALSVSVPQQHPLFHDMEQLTQPLLQAGSIIAGMMGYSRPV